MDNLQTLVMVQKFGMCCRDLLYVKVFLELKKYIYIVARPLGARGWANTVVVFVHIVSVFFISELKTS